MQINFVIPKDAIPARMGLLVTVFLCMINTFNSVASRSLPSSGGGILLQYVTASIFFVIVAILEYALILSFSKSLKPIRVADQETGEPIKQRDLAKLIDRLMLFISPPIFIAFSVLFWTLNGKR